MYVCMCPYIHTYTTYRARLMSPHRSTTSRESSPGSPGVCVYVCMCICMYIYIYIYIYSTRESSPGSPGVYARVRVCLYVSIHTYIQIDNLSRVGSWLSRCVCARLCMFVCPYIHILHTEDPRSSSNNRIHTYIHTHNLCMHTFLHVCM